jgi:hypothetical protein
MALAKLEMLEKQGCKVGESRWISCGERQPKEYKAESEDKE